MSLTPPEPLCYLKLHIIKVMGLHNDKDILDLIDLNQVRYLYGQTLPTYPFILEKKLLWIQNGMNISHDAAGFSLLDVNTNSLISFYYSNIGLLQLIHPEQLLPEFRQELEEMIAYWQSLKFSQTDFKKCPYNALKMLELPREFESRYKQNISDRFDLNLKYGEE